MNQFPHSTSLPLFLNVFFVSDVIFLSSREFVVVFVDGNLVHRFSGSPSLRWSKEWRGFELRGDFGWRLRRYVPSDGSEIRRTSPVEVQVVYPMIYKVSYIPGGAGFLPSTVVQSRGSNGEAVISLGAYNSTPLISLWNLTTVTHL